MLKHENPKEDGDKSFIERMANQIGISANAKHVFGDPVIRDSVTVIPLARAAYGFGGGSGNKENEKGSGGGGGLAIAPAGYIEIKNGETHFRSTRDWLDVFSVIATLIPSVIIAAWGINKLIKRNGKQVTTNLTPAG